jgi:hypothetical protein
MLRVFGGLEFLELLGVFGAMEFEWVGPVRLVGFSGWRLWRCLASKVGLGGTLVTPVLADT